MADESGIVARPLPPDEAEDLIAHGGVGGPMAAAPPQPVMEVNHAQSDEGGAANAEEDTGSGGTGMAGASGSTIESLVVGAANDGTTPLRSNQHGGAAAIPRNSGASGPGNRQAYPHPHQKYSHTCPQAQPTYLDHQAQPRNYRHPQVPPTQPTSQGGGAGGFQSLSSVAAAQGNGEEQPTGGGYLATPIHNNSQVAVNLFDADTVSAGKQGWSQPYLHPPSHPNYLPYIHNQPYPMNSYPYYHQPPPH